jgi:hypothetical protein
MMLSRLLIASLLLLTPLGSAQDPGASNVDVRDVSVVTARVDRIDSFGRSLSLQTPEGMPFSVFVGRGLKIFDELRAGDTVTVRVTESVVVVPRPRAKTTIVEDQTASANKGPDGTRADVLQRLKAIVTIESVDQTAQTIAYRGADNRSVTRMVANRRLLDGLKPGDIVEITYSRERTIEPARNP